MLQIIDLFPSFMDFWPIIQHAPLPDQLDAWANIYMAPWPELLQKQLDDYADLGEDWQDFAGEHVFPHLDVRLPAMVSVHAQLPSICQDVYRLAQQRLGLDCNVTAVFYVGIGCGAGWVTTYEDQHAILFGLENIAEEGWTKRATLRAFVAHELGHVLHFHLRRQANLAQGDGPWWQLYTEGFAQWCEHQLMDRLTWHMQDEQEAWLSWCRANRRWLAAEFLARVDAGESTRPFFGSWYEIQGHKQTGYYLGHEVISILAKEMNLEALASLEDMTPIRRVLATLAA